MPASDGLPEQLLELRLGCRLEFESVNASPIALMVEPAPEATLSVHWTLPDGADPPPPECDAHGNRVRRLVLPVGLTVIGYEATVRATVDADPDPAGAGQHLVQDLPADVLPFLLPSRYCESDRLVEMAWTLFGDRPAGAPRVQAVCDWVHGHLTFGYGTSDSHTSAWDVLASGRGVCRDFAHLAIGFCRALSIPTRYAFGYLPDIGVPPPPEPMDFCAWMEVYLDRNWWAFDPRNLARRIGRRVVGRGRDAADVAMITTWGPAQLRAMKVIAESTS